MRWKRGGATPDVIDCYSGVWARGVYEAGQLEEGDVEKAFTRGSSEQRRRWFDVGRSTGDRSRCDTFAGDDV